jgi:hypothetical protein
MVAAAVGAVAAIGGAVISSNAAGDAADAQTNAANQANATELAQYNQNREDAAPWREAGVTALGQLASGTANGGEFNRNFTMADFNQDPGYAFRQQQGQRGVENSAAARGGLLNGGTLKALDRYNQDYASGEYSNAYNRFNQDQTARFNRLSSLAGTGQTANAQIANQGAQVASNIANNQIGAGNAQASSYIGQGNAYTGAAQSLGNFAIQQQYMNSLGARAGSSPVLQNTAPYASTGSDYNALGYQ